MAIPNHARVSMVGTLPGSEVFSFGWSYSVSGTVDQAALDALVAGVKAAASVAGVVTPLRNALGSNASYSKITAYYYLGGATAASLYSESVFAAAGLSGATHPNQTAMVVTTLTGLTGRQRRGRMFVPATGQTLDGASQVATSDLTAIVGALKSIVNGAPSSWSPVVISRVGSFASTITQLRVDSRLDVQRRRANKQVALSRAFATL